MVGGDSGEGGLLVESSSVCGEINTRAPCSQEQQPFGVACRHTSEWRKCNQMGGKTTRHERHPSGLTLTKSMERIRKHCMCACKLQIVC